MASEKERTHTSNSGRDSAKDEKRASESRDQKESGKEKDTRKTTRSEQSSDNKQTRAEKSNRSSARGESKLEQGKSARTTDHNTIRRWIEERDGRPASVKATESGEDPGLLRVNFPGYSGKFSLEDIPWEDFFKKFDEKNLEFLYQDETASGKTSRFFRFVNRRNEGDGGEKSSRSRASRSEGDDKKSTRQTSGQGSEKKSKSDK